MTIDMKDMSGKILWTKGYETGVEAERERIITLLQADICPDWATQIFYCCDGACSAYSDAIALIKGEQK
jgi:hypothetical protein